MARVCSLCTHPERKQIDKRIASGAIIREITETWSELSASSVWRHTRNCIPAQLELADKKAGEGIDAVLQKLTDKASALLDDEDKRLMLTAVGEVRKNLELRAKLEGRLRPGGDVTIQTATQINIGDRIPRIWAVLSKYPEVKAEVVRALDEG